MKMRKRWRTEITWDYNGEQEATEAFMAARQLAKADFMHGEISREQCLERYVAAGTAFKLATGRLPPYGPGVAKNPKVP